MKSALCQFKGIIPPATLQCRGDEKMDKPVMELRVKSDDFKEILMKLIECEEYHLVSDLITGIQTYDFSSKAIRRKED